MIIHTQLLSELAMDRVSAHRTRASQAVRTFVKGAIRPGGFPPSHLALARWSCLSTVIVSCSMRRTRFGWTSLVTLTRRIIA